METQDQASSTTPTTAPQTQDEGGQQQTNPTDLRCPQCNSLLLLAHKATLCQRQIMLHKSRAPSGQGEEEALDWHWQVESMFDFENMGFSNTLQVGRPAKYLTCADCEQDVLGVHFLDEQRMYLATSRVAPPHNP